MTWLRDRQYKGSPFRRRDAQMKHGIFAALLIAALVGTPVGLADAARPTRPRPPMNIDVPPTGMFEGVSFDGGQTWTTKLIGNNDNLGDACCDPSLSFDKYGNLFMTYLYNVEIQVPIALSTDGGLHFNLIANLGGPRKPRLGASVER